MFFAKITRRSNYEKNLEDKYFPYRKYRDAIAEDCTFRCVYCDNHQDAVGGLEAMEMDHFRPWRKTFPDGEQKFLQLRDDPLNLVHACGVCNGFKWSHWPTEDPAVPYDHEKGWIPPFDELRENFFSVANDGTLVATAPPASYQIKQLRLNRPFLKRQRELRLLISQIEMKYKHLWEQTISSEPNSLAAEAAQASLAMLSCMRGVYCPP